MTKLVALRPGNTVQEMIKNAMLGKDEGADNSGSEEGSTSGEHISSGIAGRVSLFLFDKIIISWQFRGRRKGRGRLT